MGITGNRYSPMRRQVGVVPGDIGGQDLEGLQERIRLALPQAAFQVLKGSRG